MTRREFLGGTMAVGAAPMMTRWLGPTRGPDGMRCINVVNFIRGVEPRFQTDLLLPVQKQMELILAHKLPATWLLQFDALVAGPFVDYLKTHMAGDHEVGFWFEMNEKLVRAAGVEWRGRPGYEWDWSPSVAFTIGYTPEERIQLADAAMREFKAIWGRYPSSVASWNLDSVALAHLSEHYGVSAFAVCRDQIATDGFTIWGAPIAGYYPSKVNCWSPALSKANQIHTPVFRMLGQDPVYYYGDDHPMPDGKRVRGPDTMEPAWISGRDPAFIKNFLAMIESAPTGRFAYAQLGQENSFPWPDTQVGYPLQMAALGALRDRGLVHVETMGDTGRRFKGSFDTTPTQTQVMLEDPFGNAEPAETTVWYQSRFYRANLHFRGDLPYFRDITVYSDKFEQPFLRTATRLGEVSQRMPAVLDGYHWRRAGVSDRPGAGGFFELDGKRLRLIRKPEVREVGDDLSVALVFEGNRKLTVGFSEEGLWVHQAQWPNIGFRMAFEWDPGKSALTSVTPSEVKYRWQEFDYRVKVATGTAEPTPTGFVVAPASGGDFPGGELIDLGF